MEEFPNAAAPAEDAALQWGNLAEAHGSDATYSPSAASADGHDEGDDYSSVHGGSSSDIYVADLPDPTELAKLFSKAVPEFALLERNRAHDLIRFEQLKKRHEKVVEKGVTLGQELQDLEAKLDSSKAMLNDMQARLTQFLGMLSAPVAE